MGLRPPEATGANPGEIDVLRKRIADFERRVPLLESALGVAEAGQLKLLAENQTLVETARKEAADLQYSREQHVVSLEDNATAALAFEERLAAKDASIAGLMEKNLFHLTENERLGRVIATLTPAPDAAAAPVPVVTVDAERVLVLEALLRTATETSVSLEAELVKKDELLAESEQNYRAATVSLRRDDARIAALKAQVIALEAQVTTGNQPIIFGTIGRDNVIRARVFQGNDLMGGDVVEVAEFRQVAGSSVASNVSYDPAIVQGSDASFDPDGSSSIAVSPVLLPVVTDPLAVAPAVVLTAAPVAKGVVVDAALVQAVIKIVKTGPSAFVKAILVHSQAEDIMKSIIQDLLEQDHAQYERPVEGAALITSLAEDIQLILPSVWHVNADYLEFKRTNVIPDDFTYVPMMKPADLLQHFTDTDMDAVQCPANFHIKMVMNYVAWRTETSKQVAEILKAVAQKQAVRVGWRAWTFGVM